MTERPGSFHGDPCELYWSSSEFNDGHLGLLSADELDRRRGFKFLRDADTFTASRILLRLVLADRLGEPAAELRFTRDCIFCPVPHGKPRLGEPRLGQRDGQVHFNVSRSSDFVVVAVDSVEVGIDLEAVSEHPLGAFAGMALHSSERAIEPADMVSVAREQMRFWTRKEASLKAAGVGLVVDPRDIGVGASGSSANRVQWDGPHRPALPVWVNDVALPGDYVCSVATVSEFAHPVRLIDARPLLA